jgi:hypothetical protein
MSVPYVCDINGMSIGACLSSSELADISGDYYGTSGQQIISQNVLPPTLQTAVTNCTNDGSCNVISYDPIGDFAAGYTSVGYTINTLNTTGENNVVLVKNTAQTPVSLIAPAGYSYQSYGTEDWGGNPSPPSSSTNIISTPYPQYSDQDSCARACNNLPGCLGFNFDSINSACFFFNGLGANVFSDSFVGFYKKKLPTSAFGSNPSQSNFTTTSRCNTSACDSNVSALARLSGISGFTTSEIEACNLCPPRSITIDTSSFIVTNEIGTSTRFTDLSLALNSMKYNVPANPFTGVSISDARNVTSYMYPSCKSTATFIPAPSAPFYTINGRLFNNSTIYTLHPVDYVNNGYIIQGSTFIKANPNGSISTTQTVELPPKYSNGYNELVFILS